MKNEEIPRDESADAPIPREDQNFQEQIFDSKGDRFFSGCFKKLPLDPKTMKNEGLKPPNIWVITPKNEGFGFPW